MREILFRGWRMYYGGWVYGSLIYEKNKTWSTIIDEYGTQYPIETASVGQYLGFKDNNGIEIYEGDIVKTFLYDGTVEKHTITWNPNNYKFVLGGLWAFDNTLRCEIIGNIHDNPELLEVE